MVSTVGDRPGLCQHRLDRPPYVQMYVAEAGLAGLAGDGRDQSVIVGHLQCALNSLGDCASDGSVTDADTHSERTIRGR